MGIKFSKMVEDTETTFLGRMVDIRVVDLLWGEITTRWPRKKAIREKFSALKDTNTGQQTVNTVS